MQAYDSMMRGCFCIRFIHFMFKIKSLIDFMDLFLSNNFKDNDKILQYLIMLTRLYLFY